MQKKLDSPAGHPDTLGDEWRPPLVPQEWPARAVKPKGNSIKVQDAAAISVALMYAVKSGSTLLTAPPVVILRRAAAALAVAWLSLAQPASAAEGVVNVVVNVRDYGAKGDGVTDDTAAIRRAIANLSYSPGRTFWKTPKVFFPAGTYLVRDTIARRDSAGHYTSGLVLMGAGPDRSVIRLADRVPAFMNAESPKPVVMTTSRLLDGSATSGGKDYRGLGEGNDAYNNYVEDLSIDVGAGNVGAIALDYLANNVGAVRRVKLTGRPGSGAVGLSLRRKWIGPALVEDIVIDGFEYGVDVANTEYGITMAHVDVRASRRAGLRNAGNMVAIDGLTVSAASGPAVENGQEGGLIVLTNASLSGSGPQAIVNRGYLNLSSVTATGFPLVLAGEPGTTISGVFSPTGRTSSATRIIPPKDPPALPALGRVAEVAAYGAIPNRLVDSTRAIQAAMNSGAATVVFPYGDYMITKPIDIPATVRRIRGSFAALNVGDRRDPKFDRRRDGMFRVASSGDSLHVDKLTFDMTDRGGQLAFELSGARTLVLDDIVTAGTYLVRRTATGGEFFADNSCCGPITLAGPAGVWLRQFNSEARRGVRLTNEGAPVRVLGMKTESEVTVVDNAGGGVTEVLGGFFYPVVPGDEPQPLVRNRKGRVVLSYVEEAFRSDAVYDVHIESTSKGTRVYGRQLRLRNKSGARIVPQLGDVAP